MNEEATRDLMLAELRADLAQDEIPGHAMTFKEIHRASGGASECAIRAWIQEKISCGEWKSARRGQAVYYWKADMGAG